MLLVLDQTGPVYRQLYRALRHAILRGQMEAGSRLPSSRDLALDLGVSRNTVLLAYDQLLAEGYAVGRMGAGTYISDELPPEGADQGRATNYRDEEERSALSSYAKRAEFTEPGISNAPPRSIRYDFKYGISSANDFPFEIWRRLLSEKVRNGARDLFVYGEPQGTLQLREAIASYVRRSRGVVSTADQVLVVNGSQQALDLIGRALLDEGDGVVIEEPSYIAARDVFKATGARLLAGKTDQNGLDVDALPRVARSARLAYVTPSHQFPTGAVMSLSRRLALLNWAEKCGAYIIEDDYDSEFRYDGKPIESVQSLSPNGSVIYVGTLSKALTPSFRVGYIIPPRRLLASLRTMKTLSDLHTATLQQNVLADFIQDGHFERHLRRARRNNAARRAALLEALTDAFGDRIEIEGTNAGLHLVAWFKHIPAERTQTIIDVAKQHHIGVYSIAPYYLKPPPHVGLLLGYSAMEVDDITKGVAQLAACVLPEIE